MRQLIVAIGCFVIAGTACGQTMYKCQVDGKTTYSGQPCAAGTEAKRIRADAAPSPSDADARREQMMRDYDAMRAREAQADADHAAAQAEVARGASDREARSEQAKAEARANEKILVHTPQGWLRLTPKEAAQREAQIQAKREALAAANARRPAPTDDDITTSRTPAFATCNGGQCTDGAGNVFQKQIGSPNNYTGPKGESCYRTGNAISCF